MKKTSPLVHGADTPTSLPKASATWMLQKLTNSNMVHVAADHNKRARWCHAMDVNEVGQPRSCNNESLYGPDTPKEVAQRARDLMAAAGVPKLRKDAVRAIEIVISLNPNHGIDELVFFRDSMAWCAKRFGGIENLLSADIHRDERAPHVHILILPLVHGRMHGSNMLGGPNKFRGHRNEFVRDVCLRHGVAGPTALVKGVAKREMASKVIAHLESTGDSVCGSAIWEPVCDSIRTGPEPFAAAMGLELLPREQHKPLRTMAQIFTSPGKGSKHPTPGG